MSGPKDSYGNEIRVGDRLRHSAGYEDTVDEAWRGSLSQCFEEKPISVVQIVSRDGLPFDSAEAAKSKRYTYADGQEVRVGDVYTHTDENDHRAYVVIGVLMDGFQVRHLASGLCSRDAWIEAGIARLIRRAEPDSEQPNQGARLPTADVTVGDTRVRFAEDIRVDDKGDPEMVSGEKARTEIAGRIAERIKQTLPPPLTLVAFDKIARTVVSREAPKATMLTDGNSSRLDAWISCGGITEHISFVFAEMAKWGTDAGDVEYGVHEACEEMVRKLGRREVGR